MFYAIKMNNMRTIISTILICFFTSSSSYSTGIEAFAKTQKPFPYCILTGFKNCEGVFFDYKTIINFIEENRKELKKYKKLNYTCTPYYVLHVLDDFKKKKEYGVFLNNDEIDFILIDKYKVKPSNKFRLEFNKARNNIIKKTYDMFLIFLELPISIDSTSIIQLCKNNNIHMYSYNFNTYPYIEAEIKVDIGFNNRKKAKEKTLEIINKFSNEYKLIKFDNVRSWITTSSYSTFYANLYFKNTDQAIDVKEGLKKYNMIKIVNSKFPLFYKIGILVSKREIIK